jgi:hypothetical protein
MLNLFNMPNMQLNMLNMLNVLNVLNRTMLLQPPCPRQGVARNMLVCCPSSKIVPRTCSATRTGFEPCFGPFCEGCA